MLLLFDILDNLTKIMSLLQLYDGNQIDLITPNRISFNLNMCIIRPFLFFLLSHGAQGLLLSYQNPRVVFY